MDKLSENDTRKYVCDDCIHNCKNQVIGCSAWQKKKLDNRKCPKCGNEKLKVCWYFYQHSCFCDKCNFVFPLDRISEVADEKSV